MVSVRGHLIYSRFEFLCLVRSRRVLLSAALHLYHLLPIALPGLDKIEGTAGECMRETARCCNNKQINSTDAKSYAGCGLELGERDGCCDRRGANPMPVASGPRANLLATMIGAPTLRLTLGRNSGGRVSFARTMLRA